jgi:hypothetical protein
LNLLAFNMPRGACEICGQPDAFVYAVRTAYGRTVFACVRCLNLPEARADEEDDDGDERDDDSDEQRGIVLAALERFDLLQPSEPDRRLLR